MLSRTSIGLASTLLLALLMAGAASASTANPNIQVNFGPGGRKITISSPTQAYLMSLHVQLCDGTSYAYDLHYYPLYASPYLSEDHNPEYTLFTSKPIKAAHITITNPAWTPGEKAYLTSSVHRSCGAPDPPPKLYCKKVKLEQNIFRGQQERVSFTSTRYLYFAGLRVPSVDGIIWLTNLSNDRNLRQWTGNLPAYSIPPGDYTNVWLVVQDGYGSQAKCKIGALKIHP